MPTVCVWLEDISDTVSEKSLAQQFSRQGVVTSTYIDRKTGRGLVFFETVDQAQRAVLEMRGRTIKDRRLQV
jgi:RNA recognition motif-containing protein